MIAYLILAHSDLEPLRRLVEVLGSDDRSRIYLHFDRKTPLPVWCAAAERAGALILVARVSVNWAGYSMIHAIRSLMSSALEDPQVERLVLLSGNSFPLRPMARINDEIMRLDTGRFALWKIVHGKGATATRRERDSIDKFHLTDMAALNPSRGKLRRQVWKLARIINASLPYRRPAAGVVVKGSQWFCATRSEADMLLANDDALSFRFRHSFAPDEMLFQTRWYRRQMAIDRPPRFVDEHSTIQALHYIPNHVPPRASLIERVRRSFDPRRMTLPDLNLALRSPALFARKCPPEIVRALLPLVMRPDDERRTDGR